MPRLEVIRDASLEVRGPVIYATAVVIAVFLPELFTSSVQGHFVGPLALAFIFAVRGLAAGGDDRHAGAVCAVAAAARCALGSQLAGAPQGGKSARCTVGRIISSSSRRC